MNLSFKRLFFAEISVFLRYNPICCVIKEKGFAIYTTFDIVDGIIISAKEERIKPFEDMTRM